MGTCSGKEATLTSAKASAMVAESELAAVKTLQPGQMMEVQLTSNSDSENSGNKEKNETCLILRDEKGELRALGSKCTHYGAPLAQGSYSNGVIRCPWHGACFNSLTGDIEDFPGLDSLPVFNVDFDSNGNVLVHADHDQLRINKRRKRMGNLDLEADKRVFVIVGGGAAAQTCAETLRQNSRFQGRIIMLSKENARPYDRPKLSKALSSTAEDLALRENEFYAQNDIELRLNSEVTNINTEDQLVYLADKESVYYDKLLLATGSSARSLEIAANANNVFTLRSPEDGHNLLKAVNDECDVVILGTSFIGMEVAAYLAVFRKKATITVVGRSSAPFKASLGEKVGKVLQKLHEKKGVHIINNDSIKEVIRDDHDNIVEIVLESGKMLKTDVLVLGLGAKPNTEPFKSAFETNEQGFIEVNEHLETNIKNVFAAGDIAYAPLFNLDTKAAIGHFQLAMAHGKLAAINMAINNEDADKAEIGDNYEKLRTVPFFWTTQYGKSVRFAGFNKDYDDILANFSEDESNFVVYYVKNERIVAVATMNRDPLAASFADLLRDNKTLKLDDVKEDKQWWK